MTVYYGDINADGVVDMGDALLAEGFALGIQTPTADQKRRADVNGDGQVTGADVQLIQQYIMGMITQFPVELIQPPPGTSWSPLIILGGLTLAMVALSRGSRKPQKSRH